MITLKRLPYWTGLLALMIIGAASPRVSAQFEPTREQCDRCCRAMNTDDFYYEQCKLKCFRNHSHCKESGATPTPERAEAQEAPAPRPRPQEQQPEAPQGPAQPPPGYAQPPQQGQPPRQPDAARAGPGLRWPESLQMAPGKEWEAAAQLLAYNGISPQHPNYQPALRSVEQILTQFARANPGGGRLPTAQLDRVIKQFR